MSLLVFLAVVSAVLVMIAWGARVAAQRAGENAARVTRTTVVLLMAWVVLTSIPQLSGVMQTAPLPALPVFFVTVLVGATAFALSRHGTLLALHAPPFSL